MNNIIEKPIILKLKELEEEIIKLINSSEIPAFILKPMIEKICRQLEILEEQEYLKEKENYKESDK